jgi:YegS/Rv2252/BmrU family lipid kinase
MLGTLVVVNPAAAGGRAKRRFAKLEAKVRERLGELDVEWTARPRDAERIVREAVRAGVRRILVVGGDGTMREVVAGALSAGVRSPAELGLLPFGTGGDLRRTLGVPSDLEGALEVLATGVPRAFDAGRATFSDGDGGRTETYFANVASVGISGLVTKLVNTAPKALGGRISFLVGTLRGLLRYSAPPVRLRLDGEILIEGPLVLAAIANGGWFGGGMRVAPDARADDGVFDVVVIPDFGKLRLLVDLPRIYTGTHLAVEGVLSARGRLLEAEPLPGGDAVWLEIDGEPLGRLPARFELLPGALRLLVPVSAPGARP